MEIRMCKKCGETKEFTTQYFPKFKGRPKGCTCKKCINAYFMNWKADREMDWGSDEIPPTQKDKIAALKAKFPKIYA